MADPSGVVPYHDPHDIDTVVLIDNVLMDTNNEFAMSMDELLNPPHSPNYLDINFDALNPSNDPYVQEILDDFINSPIPNHTSDPNCFTFSEAQTVLQPIDNCSYTESKLPLMAPNAPISCAFCDVLGEIIHTDGKSYTKKNLIKVKSLSLLIGSILYYAGNEVERLEIHGVLGMIDHTILQLYRSPDSVPICEFIDFCHRDAENVKQMLEQYCEHRRLAGFTLIEDPASVAYGYINEYETKQFDENSPACQFPVNVGQFEVESCEEQQHFMSAAVANKTALALQRERSSRMTLEDFVDYFHLPIEKAAKELGVCATVVKKICRKHGLGRWPHRKIKSLRRRLETLKRNFENASDGKDRARIQREIDRTLQQIDNILRAAAATKL